MKSNVKKKNIILRDIKRFLNSRVTSSSRTQSDRPYVLKFAYFKQWFTSPKNYMFRV